MKKIALATLASFVALAGPASAADLDRELGLIVSGVVDSWAGVQIIDEQNGPDDVVFTNGGEGLLSLPLGENLSIQSDVKYEYNEYALENPSFNDPWGPRYSFQGAAHLSWRDPTTGLFGAFGGVGTSSYNAGGNDGRHDFRFVGGEAQFYLNDITFYGQGGYIDFVERSGITSLDEGLFARGVLRWFVSPDSRLQLETTYADIDYVNNGGSTEWLSGEVRYDFTFASAPVVGDVPLYIAYRGTHRDNCTFNGGDDVTDHTFMVGTSYSFSGDRLTVDRRGATLDTPDFGNMATCSIFD